MFLKIYSKKYTESVYDPFPSPCRRGLNNDILLHFPFFPFDDFFHIILKPFYRKCLNTNGPRDISVISYIYHDKEGGGNRLIGIP